MYEFRITFNYNGLAKSVVFNAESDGEAIEQFESSQYADCEIIGVTDLTPYIS